MKRVEPFSFSSKQCRTELKAFRKLLAEKEHLSERDDILPFFGSNRHLAAFLGSFNPYICSFDRLATELHLFGDYRCDLAVGDSSTSDYCFVEFEDASPTSVFVKKTGRSTPEWSPRLDHGFGQIIDWFSVLEDLQGTRLLKSKFDADEIQYVGLLVIGRRNGLLPGEVDRLARRSDHVRVGGRQVHCITFDGLYDMLSRKAKTWGVSI